jgi:hypothetical protein
MNHSWSSGYPPGGRLWPIDCNQVPLIRPQASIRSMLAWAPWSLARRAAFPRRAVLLFVLAALLYGFGMHAARACAHQSPVIAQLNAMPDGHPCHGDVDLAEAACEAHCRTDTQTGRLSLSFDLPAAAPLELAPSLAPPPPIAQLALDAAPPRRDTGPPLHILLHRLLR